MRGADALPVCVIGAGSSGLAAARNLLAHGIQVEVLERAGDLGGNWNYGLPHARVYASTRMISSKPLSEYTDFPMSAELPDYPHHAQVLDYLRAYADAFDLGRVIRYACEVESLRPVDRGEWEVVANGELRRYAAVVIATGHNWDPRFPTYPGSFAGEVLHSAAYRTPEIFSGKRVVVVGGGNSGCDIAVEAAEVAVSVHHSTRRAYHYIPRYVLGRPSDQVAGALRGAGAGGDARAAAKRALMRLSVAAQRASGLPVPDHDLYETHPIVNSELPALVGAGKITPKPDVASFDGETVRFVDGTHADADVVVYATGYRTSLPFIDPEMLAWGDAPPCLYLNVFHPRFDTLFAAGMIQPSGGQFGLVDLQARAIALFLSAGNPAAVAELRARKRAVESTPGSRFAASPRHWLEVDYWEYRETLTALVGDLRSDVSSGRVAR